MSAKGASQSSKRSPCGPHRQHGNGVEPFRLWPTQHAKTKQQLPLQTTRLLQTDFPPKPATHHHPPARARTNAPHHHRRAEQPAAVASGLTVRKTASPALHGCTAPHEEPDEGGAAGRAGRRGAAPQRGRPPGLRLLHLRHRRHRRRLGLPREQGPGGRRRRCQGRRRRGRGRGRGGARRLRAAHRAGARHLRLRQRQAGRAVVLRRRGDEGRAGAGAGPGVADQRARPGAGALLLPQGRDGGLRRGTQPGARARPVRPDLRARPLPGVGRGAPGASGGPLGRRAGDPPAAADAPRRGLRDPHRHVRALGARRHLPLRRAQRHHARLHRRHARRRWQLVVDAACVPPPDLPRRQRAVPLAGPPLAEALLRLRLRPLRHVAARRRGVRARGPPPRRRRQRQEGPVRDGGLDRPRPHHPGRRQDQRPRAHLPIHLLLQLRQPPHHPQGRHYHHHHRAVGGDDDPPAALPPRPADVPLALPHRRRSQPAVPGVQGRGLGGQRRRAQHLLHDAPEGPRRAPQRAGGERRGLLPAAPRSLVLQGGGGGPHGVRHQPAARWRAVRPRLRQHLPKLPEACLPDCPAAHASRSQLIPCQTST